MLISCPEAGCPRSGEKGFSRSDDFFRHVKKRDRKEVVKDGRGYMLVKYPDP